jgi:hypothetical protein
MFISRSIAQCRKRLSFLKLVNKTDVLTRVNFFGRQRET